MWFGLAAALSAGVTIFANRLLARRPWSARFAAALFLLLLGTAGLSTFFMTLEDTLTSHQRYRFTILFKLWIFAVSGVGELYNVLAIAARLLLPLGLPLTVLFAILIARKPR